MRDQVAAKFRDRYFDEDGWTALSKGIGNCGEMASAAFSLMSGLNRRVELVMLRDKFKHEDGNHAFAVIDRAIDSDINNPSTWGKNAVIVDAWSGNVYLASEVPTKLKNFRNANGKYFLASYNPHNDILISVKDYQPNSKPTHRM